MKRSFRIIEVSPPQKTGLLEEIVQVKFHYEYNPGDPYHNQKGILLIHTKELDFTAISGPYPPDESNAISRLAWFAANWLIENLPSQEPNNTDLVFLYDEEIQTLLKIDPSKVHYIATDWTEIPDNLNDLKNIIFISCGQRTDEEKNLGNEISKLVNELTDFEPYFAEYQHTLGGLTENIFNALHQSRAFIAVMHRRDLLPHKEDNYRGSVWIEQEIALAAFMVQSLKINLPSKAYVEKGIIQEGVRGYIHLNPMPFETNEQILDDLRSWLPTLDN